MAEPAKKLSKTRTNRRRATYTVSVNSVKLCSNCQQPIMPHQVCRHCGYYNGKPTWKNAPTKRIVVGENDSDKASS